VLRLTGTQSYARRPTNMLSGGQTQRVRFGVALIPNADLLVLDESTGAIDVEGRRGFWAAMREVAEEGKTVIFATHYLEEADAYADRIVLITAPVTTPAGTRIAAMRLADPRVHALLAALCTFRILPRGFANRDLRPVMAQLLGVPAGTITPGKMTYDLRRLRAHGLIERIPGTFRYQVTGTGLAQALFLTRLHDKFLRTGLAALTAPAGNDRGLAAASRAYTAALDDLAQHAGLPDAQPRTRLT